jgi:hypothetical protein
VGPILNNRIFEMHEGLCGNTNEEQLPWEKVKDRDERYGVETSRKKEARNGIEGVETHEDADGCWKGTEVAKSP